jgi:endonuclease G
LQVKEVFAMRRKKIILLLFLIGILGGFTAYHISSRSLEFDFLPMQTPLIERKAYTLSYDGKTRNAHWVYERLFKNPVPLKAKRAQIPFLQDPTVFNSSHNSDYKGSGFDRGHLCPAENAKFEQEAMDETFYLSNISPQDPLFNRIYWRKMEQYVRKLINIYDTVHVITGPLFLPHEAADGKRYVTYQVIGKNNVAVPTHFFKIIQATYEGKIDREAYLLPNQPIDFSIPLDQFAVPLETIEQAAGIVFKCRPN